MCYPQLLLDLQIRNNYICNYIDKYHFNSCYISNAVYLEMHGASSKQFPPFCMNSIGVLSNGLLAEFIAISPQVITWRWMVMSHKQQGKHALGSYTSIMDPLALEIAHKVVKGVFHLHLIYRLP